MTRESQLNADMFETKHLKFDRGAEDIVEGGRNQLPLVKGMSRHYSIDKIAVIGFGNQGESHARNIRDTFASTQAPIDLVVGLQRDGPSWHRAIDFGFTPENGTLLSVEDAVRGADLILLLVPDEVQVEIYEDISTWMKPGATLGLAHGFLEGYLNIQGKTWPEHINVIGCYPKGVGPRVRHLYERGTGTNCSVSCEQGDVLDVAIMWALAIGAPMVSLTTMTHEWKSDLTGERFSLMGALYAISKVIFAHYAKTCNKGERFAYLHSAYNITGPITDALREKGIAGLAKDFEGDSIFERMYCATYPIARRMVSRIYGQVENGNEIRNVISRGDHPKSSIGGAKVWQARCEPGENEDVGVDVPVAAMYLACIMAQMDELIERGHPLTEVANESYLEALYSLNPVMRGMGIAKLFSGCSVTANWGAGIYGPVFASELEELVLPRYGSGDTLNREPLDAIKDHPIHVVLEALAPYQTK